MLRDASQYTSVAVLLVRWEDWLDPGFDAGPEIDELRKVFGDRYGFATEDIVLDTRREEPQAQLARELSNFISKHDGPRRTNLLIVYYIGRSLVVDEDGAKMLYMSGIYQPKTVRDRYVVSDMRRGPFCSWKTINEQLERAQADVLTIIDACYAVNGVQESTTAPVHRNIGEQNNGLSDEYSTANKHFDNGTRSFETLAAAYDWTSKPGPASFTNALTRTLVEAHEESLRGEICPIDTRNLRYRIVGIWKARLWPVPPLYNCNPRLNSGHIVLEALVKPLDPQPTGSRSHEDSPSKCESEDDDAGSISSEMSIASSVSSIQSLSASGSSLEEEVIRAFAYNVSYTLELAGLSTAALAEPRIGAVRFARNFRRLIAQFGANARKQGATSTQLQAARLLRSKRISSRAAQLVVELIEADQLAALGFPGDETSNHPEADDPLALGGPDTVNASDDADASDEADNDGGVQGEAYDSEPSDEEDEVDDENDDDAILSQGVIEQIKLFLLRSEAYADFRTQLLNFVHGPYEKRLYAALRDSAIISESGTPASPEAKLGLLKELAWVPPSLFNFVFEVQFPRLNHLKASLEDSLGETWDWWPFHQRVRSLSTGYCRLTWVTPSGSVRSLDITTAAQEAFEKVVRTAPAFLSLTDAEKQTVAGIKQSTTRTGTAVNQPAAGSTSPAQGVASNSSGQSIMPQGATTSPTTPAGPAGTRTSASHANTRTSAYSRFQPNCRHVYLCVKTGSDHDYQLRAIRSDQFRCDGDFFAELRSQYLEARGWWRNTFSWWRYDHCEFYRFYKYAIERSEPKHADFPADTNLMYDCEPSPPESRPPEGPVSPGEFRDRFYHCYACHSWHRHRRMVLFNTNDDYVLKALPKRKQVLDMADGKREYFWGIYAKERRCFRWVAAYATLANVPGLVFVFLWLFQWKHAGDLQGATVLAQVSMALSIAFVGAIWADKS